MIKLLIISLFLCALVPLWLCLLSSTTVESALQIHLFMQNEPNFRKSQMNVNKVLTKDYEKRTLGGHGKNEPKTNPIRTQSKPIKANKMPKQTQNEPNQTQFQRLKMLLLMTQEITTQKIFKKNSKWY